MSNVTGSITAVFTQPRNTRFGLRPVTFVTINGENYQLGFGKHSVKVGDSVGFEVEDKGYGPEAKKGSLTILGVPTGAAPVAATPAVAAYSGGAPKSGGKSSGVFPIPALSGERAIIRQNALTQAREVVLKTMPVVSEVGRSPAHANDVLTEEIIRLARRFEAYAAGDTDMAEAKAEVKAGS